MGQSIFAANWKMNKGGHTSGSLATSICEAVTGSSDKVILCPPFTGLDRVSASIKATDVKLGAQNMHIELSGAYTGEISAPMLVDSGCQYVILGHSERRQYFSESDLDINKKVSVALAHKLIPILCVGERLEDRESGNTLDVVGGQLEQCLDGIDDASIKEGSLLIAYEPVWAIGTGKVATPDQAQEVHAFIRNFVTSKFPEREIPILYGGSVKPDNAGVLLSEKDIDGFLVGGASLSAEDFSKIVCCQSG